MVVKNVVQLCAFVNSVIRFHKNKDFFVHINKFKLHFTSCESKA